METQEELSAEVTSKAEKVHALAEAIGKKLAQAEQAGAEGKVDESIKLMEEVEQTRKKKADAEQEYRNSMPASSYQQQKLRVCEVCSAYLGIHDNDRRLADHFGGKLHLGFIKIREKLDKLLVLLLYLNNLCGNYSVLAIYDSSCLCSPSLIDNMKYADNSRGKKKCPT